MRLTLLVLAAGHAQRYGRLKQLEPVGPGGGALMDYAIYDAVRAGVSHVAIVVAPERSAQFRAHVREQFGDTVPVSFVPQELDALPEGFTASATRTKPWGTGHAVLSAAAVIDGPFIACNADDFYGAEAFAALVDHLHTAGDATPPTFAAVGYRLSVTLSPHGGVSRGICDADARGFLEHVTEVREIREREGRLTGVTAAGLPLSLRGDETVSMSLGGFTPALFPALRDGFVDFLRARGADPTAEFLTGDVINRLVRSGRANVRLLTGPDTWLGMTYQEDAPLVAARIAELVAQGHYPDRLVEGLR